MADDAYGDSNTGASAQDQNDFSAMATFERLKRLEEAGRKIKDNKKCKKPYDYSDKHPHSGSLDTQLFNNRKLKKIK